MKNTLFLTVSLAFWACTATKNTVSVLQVATPLPAGTQVEVIGAGQKVPEGARMIGAVKIGDGWTAARHCTYTKVVQNAQQEARQMGGNLIQITKHREPDLSSTCHRIECDVYLVK